MASGPVNIIQKSSQKIDILIQAYNYQIVHKIHLNLNSLTLTNPKYVKRLKRSAISCKFDGNVTYVNIKKCKCNSSFLTVISCLILLRWIDIVLWKNKHAKDDDSSNESDQIKYYKQCNPLDHAYSWSHTDATNYVPLKENNALFTFLRSKRWTKMELHNNLIFNFCIKKSE